MSYLENPAWSSYTPVPFAAVLSQWTSGSGDHAACVSLECMQVLVNGKYSYRGVEAVAVVDTSPASASASAVGDGVAVPLATWYSASRNDYALTNDTTTPPDATGRYEFVRLEVRRFIDTPLLAAMMSLCTTSVTEHTRPPKNSPKGVIVCR